MHQIHLKANKKKKNKVKMPMCDYGSACNRKNCCYRHPPKGVKFTPSAIPVPEGESRPVCVHYLVGSCEFGSHCANKHIYDEAEKMSTLARVTNTPCLFGSECRNYDCLYLHPEHELDETTAIGSSAQLEPTFVKPDPAAAALSVKAKPFVPSFTAPPFTPSLLRAPTMVSNVPDSVRAAPTAIEVERLKPTETPAASIVHSTGKATVKIPTELWLSDIRRNPALYEIDDPVYRFYEVNKPHEERCRGNINSSVVVDLHFQTAISCMQVLDAVLLNKVEEVKGRRQNHLWIITGTGHHTAKGSNAAGKLFKVVKVYLDTANEYDYCIGKDNKGYAGAFKLKIPA